MRRQVQNIKCWGLSTNFDEGEFIMSNNIENYQNKRILFFGDSITALGTEECGWVGYFNEIVKPSHFENVAVYGATWEDKQGTVYDGNPVFDPNDNLMLGNVIGNQVEKVLRKKASGGSDFSDFDYIFVAAGTNQGHTVSTDDIAKIDLQFIKFNGEPLSLEDADRCCWAGAIRYFYEKMREAYPNSKIFICSPIQSAEELRKYASINAKRKVINAICDRISDVIFVDTFNCGICSIYEKWCKDARDLVDGLHPNVSGAKKIAEYNARALKLNTL